MNKIKCLYCSTRNDYNAPRCIKCGGPLPEEAPQAPPAVRISAKGIRIKHIKRTREGIEESTRAISRLGISTQDAAAAISAFAAAFKTNEE